MEPTTNLPSPPSMQDVPAKTTEASDADDLHYITPRKYIEENHSRVDVFRRSAAFQKILAYLQGCAEAVRSTPNPAPRDPPVSSYPSVRFFMEYYFPYLERLITEIPLEPMTQQRFGNRAKRIFHDRLNATVVADMERLARALPGKANVSPYGYCPPSGLEDETDKLKGGGGDPAWTRALAVELAAYMKDAFGNATRLDYGTGHELHFFVVLMICLEESGDAGGALLASTVPLVRSEVNPPPPVPSTVACQDAARALRCDYVLQVFQGYLRLMRRLQTHYSLEPAGSHGVWGLDDYHHIPYIFGASQLIRGEAALPPISPEDVCNREKVKMFEGEYMYFSMIMWILKNKAGPFSEHSNMLYNISAVESWTKVYNGMIKMYAAEVLAKFNVSQHLLFGPHLPWNTKTLDENPSVKEK